MYGQSYIPITPVAQKSGPKQKCFGVHASFAGLLFQVETFRTQKPSVTGNLEEVHQHCLLLMEPKGSFSWALSLVRQLCFFFFLYVKMVLFSIKTIQSIKTWKVPVNVPFFSFSFYCWWAAHRKWMGTHRLYGLACTAEFDRHTEISAQTKRQSLYVWVQAPAPAYLWKLCERVYTAGVYPLSMRCPHAPHQQ